MKKIITIILLTLFLFGCNDIEEVTELKNEHDNKGYFTFDGESIETIESIDIKLPHKSTPNYTYSEAIDNGDICNVNGIVANIERLSQFMRNVQNKVPDYIRFTKFTFEGELIIKSLNFDGEEITYYDEYINGVPKKDYGKYLSIDVRAERRDDKVYYEVYVYTDEIEKIVYRYYLQL